MFETRLLDGWITCIEPYFDGHLNLQRGYHLMMAQHGLYIDKLIATDDKYVIAELITTRTQEDHYEEWASTGVDEIQPFLKKGSTSDILSQSENADVRFAVLKISGTHTLLLSNR